MAIVICALFFAGFVFSAPTFAQQPYLNQFLADAEPGDMVPGATAYGEMRADLPAAPALRDGEVVGWVFVTSDLVATTGYSGKPIHILMAVDLNAKVTGVRLVKHSEPIVLVGIPNSKIEAVTNSYVGLDLAAVARSDVMAHDLDIVAGATVTIMVIDDSILRAGLRVARELGLGGLTPPAKTASGEQMPTMVSAESGAVDNWRTLLDEGSVRALHLTVGEVNDAFLATGDEEAARRPERGAPDDAFIEFYAGLVSQPTIGRSVLGGPEFDKFRNWLAEGEQAIFIAGNGRYSYKGSGYVRGGIFDRIQLIQGDVSVRFHDRHNRRIAAIAAAGAPNFQEADIFKIPAEAGFDPAKPFRIQLLVQRRVGPIDKRFITFDLGYQLPDRFIYDPGRAAGARSTELTHLWERIWRQKQVEVAILLTAIGILTAMFFFQMQLTRHARVTKWFRIAFLTFTLFFIGWYANAQLSVVNIFAFANAMMTDFSWSAFLMDPLIFILWFSVAASLLFWGRGAYCGWLCPFGALQELTNNIAEALKVPQIRVPWAIHERLWPIKYMIFLGLFGVSLYSIEMAERYSEIEPFKTAIILKFARAWPFVLFAGGLLFVGLFIERFYCRYLCPLGAALAIPGRLRMFDWLKRYRECGNPCQLCANECIVQAIHPEGHINPNECHQCMHCQVLYQSTTKCPACIKKFERRQRFLARTGNLKPGEARPDLRPQSSRKEPVSDQA
jgi:NosR/NirI family nitrous oxide reductase transcriptional regulator